MAPENNDAGNRERRAPQRTQAGILPWPTALIVDDAPVKERRKAIIELYDRVSQSEELTPEAQFSACGQLAILRQLVDLLDKKQ